MITLRIILSHVRRVFTLTFLKYNTELTRFYFLNDVLTYMTVVVNVNI